jgi:aminoglycoside 2''-phosphotransferase
MKKDFATIKRIIEKNYPDFEVHSATKLGEGWMSEVFEINQEWAFRFAKNRKGSQDLEKEIRFLPHVQAAISFNIPDFKYIGKQDNNFYFVAYKMLPGVLLEEDSILTLGENEKQRLMVSLAKFMTEVQSISINLAQSKGVPVINLETVFSELYEEVIEKVFPLLDEDTRKYISIRFDTYLNHKGYHAYTPKLIHGDLSPDHFLIDSKTKNLSGIIDFGDMAICDPDYEYLYILEDCGKSFTCDLLRERGHEHINKCLEKISYFVTFDHLTYIIEGMDRGKDAWISEGMDEIISEMNRNRG